jgi:hypothetical protein
MKTISTLALSALLTSLVAAVPTLNQKHGHAHLHKKRELVVETHLVVETVYSTTTIWVDATPSAAAAPTSVDTSVDGLFYEHHSSHTSAPAYTPPVVVPSSSSVYVAPQPPSSSSVYVAPPAPTSVYTPPPAPSTSSVYVAPTPSSVYVAPSSSAAPAPSSAAASNGKTIYTGEITYYNPAGGYGACGTTIADSDRVVAIAHDTWDSKGTMSNGNPWCGQAIKILNKKTGITYDAKVGDKCMGTDAAPCTGGNIDLTQGFFDIAFKGVDGRGHEEWFEWWEV